jgi:predicted Zn-ribbon and HTH transcriptional regulator
MDEFEAIRLADLEGLYQEAAAERMKVSRQTFGNIISSAHKKTAEAIVGAKALRIEGGVVEILDRPFVCYECGNQWALPYGSGRPEECPKCKSTNIRREPQGRDCARAGEFGYGKGRCRR